MEIERQGYAVKDHHPPISDANLVKLKASMSSWQCDSLAVQGNNYFINK